MGLFSGPCHQRLNDSIREKWTKQRLRPHHITSPAFDAVIKILRCQIVVLIIHQSDTPVPLDLFDVFQRCTGSGHCMCLEHFSRLTGAHSQTHSLTAVINITLRTGTVGCHMLSRLVLTTLAYDRLFQSPVKQATLLADFKCTVSSVQFPFLAFSFPFYYRFELIRYRFVSIFTDIFVSVFVFVNRICLNPLLCISVSVNVNYTAVWQRIWQYKKYRD